jgi:quercetin dioxygenase-like cupin family protein
MLFRGTETVRKAVESDRSIVGSSNGSKAKLAKIASRSSRLTILQGELTVMRTIEEIRIGQLAIRFLLEGQASGGSVTIFEFDVPAGAKVPIAHSHDSYEETIYGLEGVLTWTVDGHKNDLGPGQVLCIRRGAVHRFDNGHSVDAKMLAIVSPGILGPDYFREMADVVKSAAAGPPDPAALAAVMRRHGLTPVP